LVAWVIPINIPKNEKGKKEDDITILKKEISRLSQTCGSYNIQECASERIKQMREGYNLILEEGDIEL